MRLALLAVAFLAACTSNPMRLDMRPIGAGEENLGRVKAHSGGFMLLQVIPLGQNDRFNTAYQRALNAINADRLTDVTVTETWYWAGIGNGYVFQIEGTGVRNRR